MKKLKMLATLGTFLMAFFVLGLQSASAQIQGPTDAYQTLKLAAETLSPKTVAASSSSLDGTSGATVDFRAAKLFIENTLGNLGSATTTQDAIDATYDDLVAQSGGHAARITKLDAAKLYVEDLLQ